MTVNPENDGIISEWKSMESVQASQVLIGMAKDDPEGEPHGVAVAMTIENPLFEALTGGPFKVSAVLDLEDAILFHERFAEALMVVRVAQGQ